MDIDAPAFGDATLHEWMVDPAGLRNGQLLIKNLDTNTTLKVIKFYQAYLVELKTSATVRGQATVCVPFPPG